MNQDYLEWWPDLGLFVVADGMGGHNAGEVASHLAVEAIHQFIADSASGTDMTWPFRHRDRPVDRRQPVDDSAVRLANRRVYDEGSRQRGS